MKKGVVVAAVILVLGGIGSLMNKNESKAPQVETRSAVTVTATATPTAKPTAKPTTTAKPAATSAPTASPELVALEPITPAASEAPVTRSVEKTYVLNTNTKKFHYSSCSSVKQMKDSNKKDFTGSRDDVIAMGYSPCGKCNP